MVRVRGPMLSEDARGSLGSAVNFSKNRDVNYARKIPRPVDPKTASQVSSRAMLAFLSKAWHNLSLPIKETWEVSSPPEGYTPYNAFLSANLSAWNLVNAPSQANAPRGPNPRISRPTLFLTAAVKQITLSIADGVTPPSWGWAIHRTLTPIWSIARDNLLVVVPRSVTPTHYLDAPLISGTTYYYAIRGFSDDGWWGTPSFIRNATPS